MKEVSDEAVIQFVDGRMAGEELAAFEARLAQDPALAERVSAHRWITRQIVAAYGLPPEVAFDQAYLARLGLTGDNVVPISGYRKVPAARVVSWSARIGALAASLVIGVMVGQSMLAPPSGIILDSSGQLAASGVLSDRLSDQLAGEQGPVRIGVSFRAKNAVCRTFHVQQGASGLGCRQGGRWIVPIVVTDDANQNGATEYALAGGDTAPSVMAEVDRRIMGEPLTAEQETKFRAAGWR